MKSRYVKILSIVIIMVFCTMSFVASASEEISKEKAKEIFIKNKEKMVINEEQFDKEIEKRSPGEVLAAASIADGYNKSIEEIYALIDKYGDMKEVSKALFLEKHPEKNIEATPVKQNVHPNAEEMQLLSKEDRHKIKDPTSLEQTEQEDENAYVHNHEDAKSNNKEIMELKSKEERRNLKEEKYKEETEHNYKFIYMHSLVDDESNTISHLYHKICVNTNCNNGDGGFFITKAQPITKEELSFLDNYSLFYVDRTIPKEFVETIDISEPYDMSKVFKEPAEKN